MPTNRPRRNADREATCTLACIACNRPRDGFRHVHVKPDNTDAPEFALCIPCLASMSVYYEQLIDAYSNGGALFDEFMRARVKARMSKNPNKQHKPPTWLKSVLDEIDAKEDDSK